MSDSSSSSSDDDVIFHKQSAKSNFKNKNSTKNGILSVFGAITHKLGISALWVLANLSTYLISYLRKYEDPNNRSLNLLYSYFFGPILSTTITAFMPICGIVEFKLGCQKAIIIGALIIMFAYTIMYISHNIFVDMFATFLFGIGLSISTTLSTKNALLYFFNQRGTIGGILELISSSLSAMHNKIGEVIVNPDGKNPDVQDEKDPTKLFYSIEISERILNFYLLELAINGVSTLLTLLFLVPYDLNATKKLAKEIKQNKKYKNCSEKIKNNDEKVNVTPLLPEENEEDKENVENNVSKGTKRYEVPDADNDSYMDVSKSESTENNISIKSKNEINSSIKSNNQNNYSTTHFKIALKSSRVWKLFILNLTYFLAVNLVLVMWRPVGINQEIETETLQLIGTLNFIMTSIGTPFFGFLADKLQFRVLYTLIGGLTSLICFTFYFSFTKPILFSIMVCGMNFILGGHIAILPPHYMKVFGMKYYIEIGGVIGLATVIMGPLCSFFAFFLENSVGNLDVENPTQQQIQESKDAKMLAYKIIFNSGAALNIVAIIIGIFELDDEFDYGL